MLPLRDATPRLRLPVVTVALIAVNFAAFLLWQPTLSGGGDLAQQDFFWCHGLIPYEIAHDVPLARSGPDGAREIEIDYQVSLSEAGQLQTHLARICPDK